MDMSFPIKSDTPPKNLCVFLFFNRKLGVNIVCVCVVFLMILIQSFGAYIVFYFLLFFMQSFGAYIDVEQNWAHVCYSGMQKVVPCHLYEWKKIYEIVKHNICRGKVT